MILFGIRYLHTLRDKGDAVGIHVDLEALEPPAADLEPPAGVASPSVPPAVSPGALVAVPADPVGLNPPPEEEVKPLVNLLLRTRDLGIGAASQALYRLGRLGAHVNVTNGNQYFPLALLSSLGAGLSVSPSLHFNSRAATLAVARRDYSRWNGKREEEVAREFGRDRIGDGWSGSFDLCLFPFVRAEGALDDPRLVRCVEVRFPDGNRIVFRNTAALGMILRRLPSGQWQLDAPDEVRWIFDDEGRVREKSTLRIRGSNGALQPMRWDWQADRLTVTDSVGRETRFAIGSDGRFTGLEAPDGMKITFKPLGHALETVEMPLGVTWSFGYGEKGLMTRITPPLGHPLLLQHYLGGATAWVSEQIARFFWGRVSEIRLADRRFDIAYVALPPREDALHQVVCIDAQRHRWRIGYTFARLAAETVEYAHRNQPSQWFHFQTLDYRGDSKLVREITDLHFARRWYGYLPGKKGRGAVLSVAGEPGNFLREYRYNDDERLDTEIDEARAEKRYQYWPTGEVRRIDYPEVSILNFDLSAGKERLYETWAFDDRGRFTTHRDKDGIVTTYEYDEAADSGTGLQVALVRGGLRQNFAWDLLGRLRKLKNPWGHETEHEYDGLGRLLRSISSDGLLVDLTYDKMNRPVATRDSLGRGSSTLFDDFGEVLEETDAEGHTIRCLERDKNGNPTRIQQRDGTVWQFLDYDALGRWGRSLARSVARTGPDGLHTDEMPDRVAVYQDRPAMFDLVRSETSRTVLTSGPVKKTLHYDGRGLLVATEVEADGQTRTILSEYDPRGHPVAHFRAANGRRIAQLGAFSWDELGRKTGSAIGGVWTRTSTSRDATGLYSVELSPSQQRQDGPRPASLTRMDDAGRPVGRFDSRGNELLRYEYRDAEKQCRIYAVRPAETSDPANKIHILTVTYNDKGEVIRRRDERTGRDYARRRVTQSLSRDGLFISRRVLTYDALGYVASYRDELAGDLQFEQEHEPGGRRIATVGLDYGRSKKLNQVTLETDRHYRTVHHCYDESLNLVGVSDSELSQGEEYRFDYSLAGYRLATRRPHDPRATSEYQYDDQGTLRKLTHHAGEDWTKTYPSRSLGSMPWAIPWPSPTASATREPTSRAKSFSSRRATSTTPPTGSWPAPTRGWRKGCSSTTSTTIPRSSATSTTTSTIARCWSL